jgi:hypothetical protein
MNLSHYASIGYSVTVQDSDLQVTQKATEISAEEFDMK